MQDVKDRVSETFMDGGLLEKKIPNYSQRPQQVELSKKIQECMDEKKHLLAEAPTGVGKSLAALVPAFEHIEKTDEPVVVVTSSIILQEQYINKDIPFLEDLYGFPVSPVLIKGRNNYLCPKKLNEARNGKVGVSTSEQAEEVEKLMQWGIQTETGDKSELSFEPKFQTWAQLSCVEQNECTGKQCPLFNICPYYKQRNKLATSKLIVCNYHYFFTARDNTSPMLPKEAKVFIFDEGHEMNSIARDFQEIKYKHNSLRQQIDRFLTGVEKTNYTSDISYPSNLIDGMELDMVNATLNKMFFDLLNVYQEENRTRKSYLRLERADRLRLKEKVEEHVEALSNAAEEAFSYLDRFGFSMDTLGAMMEMYDDETVDWFMLVHNTAEFFEQKLMNLQFIFAFHEEQDDQNFIFWLEPYNDAISIHAKPLDGSGITKHLFEKGESVSIVMSATLAANQQFGHLKGIMGIEEDKASYPVEELIVSSPFDLENNLLWYLPDDVPPGNERDHLSFCLDKMAKMIRVMEGRCLCLFTSYKNMREAEAYFSKALPENIKIVSQGKLPKSKIIKIAKENDNTVIIGTKSFFTGIDIQGHHLSAVLIDKIPFPMLGDPVNDFQMNEPRGFHKFSLPEAIIAIKQGFGRLNRTAEDKGIVVIFDERLSTARYKNKIFNSFDFKLTGTKDWDKVLSRIDELNLP